MRPIHEISVHAEGTRLVLEATDRMFEEWASSRADLVFTDLYGQKDHKCGLIERKIGDPEVDQQVLFTHAVLNYLRWKNELDNYVETKP